MAKIAIIHHSGIIGGAGVSLINAIQLFAEKHEVTVFVPSEPRDIFKVIENLSKENHVQIKVISYGRRIGALTYYNGGDRLTSIRLIYRVALIIKQWNYWNKIIKEENPDIVIVNSIILAWMGLLKEVRKRKSICFVRETIRKTINSVTNKTIRKLLLKFNEIVFLTEYDRKSWNFIAKQSSVVPDFLNESDFDNTISKEGASKCLNLDVNSWHILYVGGVSHMKGFDLIVKAVLDLNKRLNTDLIVAGPDFLDIKNLNRVELTRYATEIEKTISQNEYRSKIHIIGRQMNMSIPYAAADVLVFPMREAHQARPVFEAGYYHLPVIISDFPQIEENVIDKHNGLLFIPNSWKSLTEKLELLAFDEILRKKLGDNNYEMMNTHHTRKGSNKVLSDIITRLLCES